VEEKVGPFEILLHKRVVDRPVNSKAEG